MAVINPGLFRESITILYNPTKGATDDNGMPITTIQTMFKLRCMVQPLSLREMVAIDSDVTKQTYRFICYNRKIDSSMLIQYKGKYFMINNIGINDHNSNYIEITATEGGGESFGIGI